MKETIGLILLNPALALLDTDNIIASATFLPVEQLPDGKVRTIAPQQAAGMKSLGLKAAAVVKTEVIRHGDKVTHHGSEVYLLEDINPTLRLMMNLITPAIVDSMMEDYYSHFPSCVRTTIEEA